MNGKKDGFLKVNSLLDKSVNGDKGHGLLPSYKSSFIDMISFTKGNSLVFSWLPCMNTQSNASFDPVWSPELFSEVIAHRDMKLGLLDEHIFSFSCTEDHIFILSWGWELKTVIAQMRESPLHEVTRRQQRIEWIGQEVSMLKSTLDFSVLSGYEVS